MRRFTVKPTLQSFVITWQQRMGRQQQNTLLMRLFTPLSEKKAVSTEKQE